MAQKILKIQDIDASGTADNTTYLRGDGTWTTVSGGGGSQDFDSVLGVGNTATNKIANINSTSDAILYQGQYSGTNTHEIGHTASGRGYFKAFNIGNGSFASYTYTNINFNGTVLSPGNAGTIAVTSDIPSTPTLSQVLIAGNNASSSSAIVDDISARLHKITNTTNSNIVSLSAPTLSAPRIVTFGDFAGEVTLNNATQTLTNKTINGPDNTITNIAQSSVTNLTTDLASKVTGPASAVDNAVTRFDSTTGKLVQNSNLLLNDEGSLTFTGVASPTYTQGKLVYDTGNEALTFYNNSSNVALQVGQEIYARVVNNTGSTINNGVVVYINGSSGGLNTIALANANALATSYVLGVTTESITNGSTGHVTTTGIVRGVNTSAYTVGTLLYLSSSSAGGLTNIEPTGTNLRVPIARVRVSNISAGEIYVFPTLPTTNSANILLGANGGTGIANTGKTITVSGNTTIGSSTHTVTFLTTANTSVTLPVSGKLATEQLTLNTQTTSYTLVLADAETKMVEINNASANNLTVPLNSSAAFPIGTQIVIVQYGAGQTSIVATGGVTIRSSGAKLKLTGQYSAATLVKRATDEWYLFGDITT